MLTEHEQIMKNKCSLTAVRYPAKKSDNFKQALVASMDNVSTAVKKKLVWMHKIEG